MSLPNRVPTTLRQYLNTRGNFEQPLFVFRDGGPESASPRPGMSRQGLQVSPSEEWMNLELLMVESRLYGGEKMLDRVRVETLSSYVSLRVALHCKAN